MKVNQTKAIVACLGIAAAAAIAGSVSGTVAWFQYNTRVTAAYVGTSASTTSNLQIKVGSGEYKQKLTSTDIATYLSGSASKNAMLHPVTLGVNQAANTALAGTFYSNPLYQYFGYSAWNVAPVTHYVTLPLTVKYTSVSDASALSGKDIWLSDLTIQNHENTTGDLYKALRVHVAATDYHLFSSESQDVTLGGALDLNNDGADDIDDSDHVHYDFSDAGTPGVYGDNTAILHSVALDNTIKPTDDGKGNLSDGDPLGQTNASGELAINVTIWLEGWQPLAARTLKLKGEVDDHDALEAVVSPANGDIYKVTDDDDGTEGNQTKWYSYDLANTTWVETTNPELDEKSAIWDNSYIGKQFDIGFRFSATALVQA